jgi:hypothetical protein
MITLNLPHVDFAEDGHTYSLDGNLLPGVTTVLACLDKPQLKAWAARLAVETVRDGWNLAKAYTEAEREALLEKGRKAHAQRSDAAKDTGKLVHQFIEDHIAGKEPALPILPEARACAEAFLDWEGRVKPVWHHSELVLASVAHRYAGTCDFLADIGGEKMALGDFKTGGVYREAWLQTAAYKGAIEECHPGLVGRRCIVNIPKPKKPGDKVEVTTAFEYTDFTRDHRAFLSCLDLYRWGLYEKSQAKEGK